MKRILPPCAAVALAVLLAGCCYKPCTYDPITGVMYGGGLEPCCCGPLDPFCLFCNGCEQPLYPALGPGCGRSCVRGWGWGANWCHAGFGGGLHCGCPHTMMPSPAFGGVLPSGAVVDGGMLHGGAIDSCVIDGGAAVYPGGMVPTYPDHQWHTPAPSDPAASPFSPPPPPPTPPEDEQPGAVVPWPMAPPAAKQPRQQPVRPIRHQSPGGRWIPARR